MAKLTRSALVHRTCLHSLRWCEGHRATLCCNGAGKRPGFEFNTYCPWAKRCTEGLPPLAVTERPARGRIMGHFSKLPRGGCCFAMLIYWHAGCCCAARPLYGAIDVSMIKHELEGEIFALF